ncbi:MAG TPA: NADH-quinone oxidoreductase subunit L, partial [Thermoplasmata archaeon]|nr:NADH-quinone oxidoreductase subunit L [Thermoplasmata archaeon]
MELAWTIPLYPFIGFLVCGLLGKHLGKMVGWIAFFFILASFFISFGVFLTVAGVIPVQDPNLDLPYEHEVTWIALGAPGTQDDLTMGVLVDGISGFLIVIVSFLCSLIMLYSVGYMAHDTGKPRFFAEMSLFIMGMEGMVISSNFLEMFIFWEIMGLCSYLLIGFWYHKPEAAKAAKKAFLTTRIGDTLFFVGIVAMYFQLHTLNVETITHEIAAGTDPAFDPRALLLPSLLLFGGAVGKSAQFPLHVWLPDAMEGPTPVSALIHAATMVKAGVFLVARMLHAGMISLEATPEAMLVIAGIGAFTAIFAATMALVMNDIKRVLAYSTLSQLGYMFLALGVGALVPAMFHLMTHAFTKALLFLGAGSVIHGVGSNDMRDMGGLKDKMPATWLTMLAGSIVMAGAPFFSLFISKDEILVGAYHANEVTSPLFTLPVLGIPVTPFLMLFGFGVATAFLTAFYMWRLYCLTFTGVYRGPQTPHESPWTMTLPLVILAVFALFVGLYAAFNHSVEFMIEGAAVVVLPYQDLLAR